MTTVNRPIQHRAEARRARVLSPAVITDRLTFELAKQLSLVMAAVLLYFGVRGATQGDASTAIQNGLKVLEFEKAFALDIESWAQGMILDHHWLVTLANWIYIWGHWPVIAATLIWLHQTRRVDYLQLRNAMFISGAIGLIIFTNFAVAPPRLLNVGLQDTVTDFSNSYRILQPPSLVNKYAAVPSLHVGWNLLIGLALYRASRRPVVRILGVLSPILMTVTVVVTANHYVIDAVLGAAVAMVGWFAALWLTPRLASLESRLKQTVRQLQRN